MTGALARLQLSWTLPCARPPPSAFLRLPGGRALCCLRAVAVGPVCTRCAPVVLAAVCLLWLCWEPPGRARPAGRFAGAAYVLLSSGLGHEAASLAQLGVPLFCASGVLGRHGVSRKGGRFPATRCTYCVVEKLGHDGYPGRSGTWGGLLGTQHRFVAGLLSCVSSGAPFWSCHPAFCGARCRVIHTQGRV